MQFTNEESLHNLRRLAARESSYVARVEHTMHLGMMPSCIGRMRSSVSQILNDKLRKYDQTLDGILLGYENVKLVGGVGHTVINSSYLHVNIHAQFYVFRPQVDAILSGEVLKCSGSRATCMLHSVFTVFVSLHEAVRPMVRPSAVIRFRVTHVDLCAAIPLVIGHTDPDIWKNETSEEELRSPADSGVSCNEEDPSASSFMFGVAVAPITEQRKCKRQLKQQHGRSNQKRDGRLDRTPLTQTAQKQHLRFSCDVAPSTPLASSSVTVPVSDSLSSPAALPASTTVSDDCLIRDGARINVFPKSSPVDNSAAVDRHTKKRRRVSSPSQDVFRVETSVLPPSLPQTPSNPRKRRKHDKS